MSRADELAHEPALKVERATHHIEDLNQQINAFLAERPFKLMLRYRRKAGFIDFVPKTYKTIPEPLSFILGDTIHNLCAALDICLYGMAESRAPTREKISFPFPRRATADALEGAINNGQVKFAGERVAEEIRRLKPYDGGHPRLSAMHNLDVLDKHRRLILTRHVPELTGDQIGEITGNRSRIRLTGPGIIEFRTPQHEAFLSIGYNFVTRELADSEEESNIQPVFNIAFGDGLPLARYPVIPALYAMVDTVKEVIGLLIEAHLAPDNTFPR